MSLWTDIRDTFTAPFRNVGDLISDIFSGKNVFASVGEFGTKQFFNNNPLIGAPATILINNTPAKDLLNNDTFNAITAGLGKDFAGIASFTQKANSGDDFTFNEARDAWFSQIGASAKIGATILTAGAAPAGAGTIGAATAGYGAAQSTKGVLGALGSGDIVGAITNLTTYTGLPDIGIPQGVKDIYDQGKKAADEAEAAAAAVAAALAESRRQAALAAAAGKQAQSLVDLTKSNLPLIESGYSSNEPGGVLSAVSENAGSLVPVLAVAGLCAYLILDQQKRRT